MLQARGSGVQEVFKEARAADDVVHDFISFMHRNFPSSEENRYSAEDWNEVAAILGIDVKKLSRATIIEKVREFSEYQEVLRGLK